MKITELHNVEDKVYYCDNQQHLKLGSGKILQSKLGLYNQTHQNILFRNFILKFSGHTVFFGLTKEGRETCLRKLKTKQLPQLQKPSFVRKLLQLRHPNLIRYDEFIMLKVIT